MSAKDKTEIKEIFESIKLLTESIAFATNAINDLQCKIEKKNTPVYLERDILQAAQDSIAKAIQSVLTGYDSPLNKLVKSVVDEQSVFLREIISDSFSQVIKTQEFKNSIISAFSHKVARTIISNNDGLFDKVSNELKQSSEFKAKMTLAVANVVNECLNKE